MRVRKIRKASITFVISVRSFVNSASTGWILMQFDLWDFFLKYVEKSKFHYSLTRIRALYINTFSRLWQHLAKLFFSEREITWRENQNMFFVLSAPRGPVRFIQQGSWQTKCRRNVGLLVVFIYSLFNNFINSLDYIIALNDRLKGCKVRGRNWAWYRLRSHLCFAWIRVRSTMKYLSQDCRCLGRSSNREPPEYKSKASVVCFM